MRTLHRALLRELGRLRAQVLTLSLVVAAGACVFVSTKVTVDALERSRAVYFRAQRFADLFASLKRAPRPVAAELSSLGGVAELKTRVVGDVQLFLPGRAQPATVHLVSVDPRAVAPLNGVRIRQGRAIDPDHEDEVVLNEPFAEANRLRPGDRVRAVLNGRLRQLRVVGIGISPEFVFSLQPGAIAPDDLRYGVGWMTSAPLEAAFDLRGAFNDVVARLAPGATPAAVIDAMDRRLRPFGGHGAYLRADQSSAKQLDARIERLHGMLAFLPTLFLAVSAFVLNVVLGRLVEGQREQIGTLQAFGYSRSRLARHYLELALLTVLPGVLVGVLGGLALGRRLVDVFVSYFRLPLVDRGIDGLAVAGAVLVCLIAAALGALGAVRRVTRLRPVEAMRAPAPPAFHRGGLERLGLTRRLPAAALLVVRNLRLAPLRAGATVAALAFATALCVTGSFFGGSLDALRRHVFAQAMRQDLQVAFSRPIDPVACASLRAIEGVLDCEPLIVVPVRVRFGPLHRSGAVTILGEAGQLRRIIDQRGRALPVPQRGLMVSRRLLQHLHARLGDSITLETIEGRPRQLALPVRAVLDDELGLNIYASSPTLLRLTGERAGMTSALLRIAPDVENRVTMRLSQLPTVVGVQSRAQAIADFEKVTAKSMRSMTTMLALLAAILAIAVVYNGARVALAERARDLASLRVLGFSRAEVARILLGEMGLAVALGVPLGLWLGRALATLSLHAMAADEVRLPIVITPATYLLAILVVVGASLLSALQLRRLINRLDLVEVLKTRE